MWLLEIQVLVVSVLFCNTMMPMPAWYPCCFDDLSITMVMIGLLLRLAQTTKVIAGVV